MKIELYFDELVYRKQMLLLYEVGYGRKKLYLKNSNYMGIFLLIIGFLAVIGKGGIGYLFIILGLGLLISFYSLEIKLKKIKRKLESEQLQIIAIFLKHPKATFEFKEETFNYSDYASNVIIKWNEFLKHIEIEENIFLITNKFQPFALGKAEVGEINYNQILNIIKNKTSH